MISVNKIRNDVCDENTYVVFNDMLDAVVIDPGSNYISIENALKNLKVHAVLLTHGHFDHALSCKKLQNLGYKIYVSTLDSEMCENNIYNSSKDFGVEFENFVPDVVFDAIKVSEFVFGSLCVKVVATPGHTKGGVSYIVENNLFAGDTLFEHGYGRTDLYGGNFRDILSSIKTLRRYTKDGFVLFSGHDY